MFTKNNPAKKLLNYENAKRLITTFVILTMVFGLVAVNPQSAKAATTELTITKYAVDGKTIIAQKTVTYQELRDGVLEDGTEIPIMGDGETVYYHQGPVFIDYPDPEEQERLRWNEEEDRNWDTKDMGAVKGTNLKDLCELVGGMEEGDEVELLASDGFKKKFAYKNVYEYSDREGPMVVCWYKDGKYPDSGYNDGMRLVWFAEATYKEGPTDVIGLPSGDYHVFGNYDWKLAAEPEYWYYYQGEYPTTTGLSVQNVAFLNIYSNDPVPARTLYVDASGEADFATIQEAVDQANDSDTIIVKDGTYTENVVVDKSLTIQSENGPDSTIVQAADSGSDVFYVEASDVTIDGFTASGATSYGRAGIKLFSSSSCTINNNKCNENSTGISIEANSKDNTVSNNNCDSNSDQGIRLTNATGNLIVGNTCSYITGSYTYALHLMDNADNNIVKDNTLDSNEIGIRVKAADSNTFINNTSSNNNIGLELATGSVDNIFYLNNFVDNTENISEGFNANSRNIWNSEDELPYKANDTQFTGYLGNYWSDYTGEDADGNGIGDTPYQTISTDADNYPLMGPWGISITPVEAPEAAFTAEPTSGKAPLEVSFTDKSTGTEPLTYAWDFDNDGMVDSTEQNPTYTYENAGTYTVRLTVSNAAGNDEEIKTDYITVTESQMVDILFDGTVVLTPGETFSVTAYNSGQAYTFNKNTPLGALHAAAAAGGFTYDVTDKNYGTSGALLLDNVGSYNYVKGGSQWYAYVNGVLKDGFNNPAGALNLIELVDGDEVEFYYANVDDETDFEAVKAAATAAVKTVVDTGGVAPTDWTLQLTGAKDVTVTKAYFEEALNCSSSHRASWTDENGDVWEGMPLWLLVAMVDDELDEGPYHCNFNEELAEKNYKVKVIAGDGWEAIFDSSDIARSDDYIVANTLNGEPLPLKLESGKGSWPLHLKGPAVLGGQQVGNIVRIELTGFPEPSEGWTLELVGDVGDVITQEEFEEGLACTESGHYAEWEDNEGNTWSGVPLWVLLGAVDDIETDKHWTFNDDRADSGYTVKVIAKDGFYKTFNSSDVARNNDYIVANKVNNEPLTGDSEPLRLVGTGVAKEDGSLGGNSVRAIAKIEIPELMTTEPEPGSWNLTLKGKITDVISQAEFQEALECPNSGHLQEWTDGNGNVWSGIPLWLLAGWVDDRQPHSFDYSQAMAGYTIVVKADDGYAKDLSSKDVAKSNDYIIANKCNGEPLEDSWPLRLIGKGVAKEDGTLGGMSVGNVAEIELASFEEPKEIPKIRIVKYDEDGVTILDELTVDYTWMQEEFDVIGDGEKVYRFQGVTFDPDNLWDPDETFEEYKIENAIKGTRVRDLCELVGGMGAGTDIEFVASDGWVTKLPYSSIYPDPSVLERQGEAVLAWFADGEHVPDYKDGMRLFFTPEDGVYGQWDMHETLPEAYWHFYGAEGIMYPSCAGLSAKWITEIRIYSVPEGDWKLELDGTEIGGLRLDVSKTYFESALTCTFGANHKAEYIDSEGQVWEGMPLWLLAGFVDDEDQHTDNAFNDELAEAGYQIVITATDGYQVTIDSRDIIRSRDYIVANTLDELPLPDDYWPLRLVGPAVDEEMSIWMIERIELVPKEPSDKPRYKIIPVEDDAYMIGELDGISTMTVNQGVSGFKYFTVGIEPEVPHDGEETVVFAHIRDGIQLELNAIKADFDQEDIDFVQAGFNVRPGDVIRVFVVDELTNSKDHNPIILQ